MCTIGNVFVKEANGIAVFKQCDLTNKTNFILPIITPGQGSIKYLPFKREGSKGTWAGINNYGVSFVAADSYLQPKTNTLVQVNSDIFEAYEKIISVYTTARDAAAYMCSFYKAFNSPDILLINDAREAYYIEANAGSVVCIKRTDNYFACTNHFRALTGAVDYKNNHSTYLRLERAEAVMQKDTNTDGIFKVVKDQYYGETVLSICRVNQLQPPFKVPTEDPYFTQATSVFFTDGKIVNCAFQLNGNPRTNKFTFIGDVFGKSQAQSSLTADEAAAVFKKAL